MSANKLMIVSQKTPFQACYDCDRTIAGLRQLRPYEFGQMRRQQTQGLLQRAEAL